MLRFAIDAVTGFSTRPLRMASYLGAFLGGIGLLSLVYVVGGVLLGRTVQGWASVMTAVVLLSSFQLFILGIIGEYLGRLFLQAKNRPLFIVSEILSKQELALEERFADPCANRVTNKE